MEEPMKPITEFCIACYHDIYNELVDIDKQIPVPSAAPKSITHVFDEEKSVRWNREQVEIFNKQASEARREAVEYRALSRRNLDKAVVDYMVEYEANSDTPRAVVEKVVARAQQDHDDDWWNYLSDYLDFAEDILSIIKED
jgi:predicted enzyme involved in methoxymalonyl-ACP biosynthesis